MPFSTGAIFVTLEPLPLQYDLTFLQNSLLSATSLTLFRMGFFGTAHRWGARNPTLHKICHTYPAMGKLGWHSYTLPAEDPKTI